MTKLSKSWIVPAGSFALASVLALVVGPSGRAIALRAAAEATGCTPSCSISPVRLLEISNPLFGGVPIDLFNNQNQYLGTEQIDKDPSPGGYTFSSSYVKPTSSNFFDTVTHALSGTTCPMQNTVKVEQFLFYEFEDDLPAGNFVVGTALVSHRLLTIINGQLKTQLFVRLLVNPPGNPLIAKVQTKTTVNSRNFIGSATVIASASPARFFDGRGTLTFSAKAGILVCSVGP